VSLTPNDYVFAPDLVAAARGFIRREGGCVVGIRQLLEELTGKFGDQLSVSPNTHGVLDLIETPCADPHADQVPHEWIDFAWNEKGWFDAVPTTGLLRRFQIPPATKEET
jgi:hypothetical protein